MMLTTHRADRPWLKITFNPTAPGDAKVVQRRWRVPGQWVVFDRAECLGVDGIGYYAPEFTSGDIADCHAYIDRATAAWQALEDAERFSG